MTTRNKAKQGISIITCTHLPNYMNHVFENFARQTWRPKELIIILNNDALKLSEWRSRAAKYGNIRIFQLPGRMSLGRCLNFGISKAKYDFIAKFDHDDYYGPRFLAEMMGSFQKTNADIVGKRSYYTFISSKKLLIIRFPNREHRYESLVHGGTFLVKKAVFNRVKFADRSLGEDVQFLKDCRMKGFRIYSAGKGHYVYIRRNNQKTHTWKISHDYLLRNSKIVAVTDHFLKYMRNR